VIAWIVVPNAPETKLAPAPLTASAQPASNP
jgi:hypothetical protein